MNAAGDKLLEPAKALQFVIYVKNTACGNILCITFSDKT